MWTGTLTRLVVFIAAAMGLWAAESNGPTAAQETSARNRLSLSLDGAWKFLPDLAAEGETRQLWKPATDALPWRDVAVPSVFEAACPEIKYYTGMGWYRRAFRLPAEWRGRRIVLHFEAVNYRAKIWLNDRLLGESRDGFLPFEFEIGRSAVFDGDNLLTVAVDNRHHEGDVPGMHTGWRGFGGILRPVSVYATAPLFIEHVQAIAVPQADARPLSLMVRVHNAGNTTAEAAVKLVVKDSTGKPVLLTDGASRTVRVGTGESADIALKDAAGFERLPAVWRRNLEGLHQRYPDKPILVTEFGAMARPGTAEEDLYARKIEADFKAQMPLGAPYLCGSVIWCWADHPWPPGRFSGGGDTSYYGVLDRNRHPKKAFDAARELFRAKQGQ